MDKINKTQKIEALIILAFLAFYGGALFVNAVSSVFGNADLAFWHYPFFAVSWLYAKQTLQEVSFPRAAAVSKRLISASAQFIRLASKRMLCIMKALQTVPSLFLQSYRNLLIEAGK